MADLPFPSPQVPPTGPDTWPNASFRDVVYVYMVHGLLSSGVYSPGPYVMQLAAAATAQVMVQTGRPATSVLNFPIDPVPPIANLAEYLSLLNKL